MGNLSYITDALEQSLNGLTTVDTKGKVEQVIGTVIRANAPSVKVGELCRLQDPWSDNVLWAEVVGLHKNCAILTPMGNMVGLSASTQVLPTGTVHQVPVGSKLLGRVLNGMGDPVDEDLKGPLEFDAYYPVYANPPDPMKRNMIKQPMFTGLRAIDGLLTVGLGQRIGIFAGPGVGKSTLLGMLANGSSADINVLALIGERGRELREFIEDSLGEAGLKKSVVVVSTSDRPAMERLKAAYVATAIAEYFRDQGKNIFLMMDSVTRFARALREIGLAAGEPPTRRGFPPSVFSNLPSLVERAGQSEKGSITAFYTILIEGDDMSEPVAEEIQSLLDGHMVLSRKLASSGHYPAIDVLNSISRVMTAVVSKEHQKAADRLRAIMAKYREIELLVQIGEYKKGADKEADEAVAKIRKINSFLKQKRDERTDFDSIKKQMFEIVG
jgi:type III secretion protein N (ATPase)